MEPENRKAKMRMKKIRNNLTDQERQAETDESRKRMRKFPNETKSFSRHHFLLSILLKSAFIQFYS